MEDKDAILSDEDKVWTDVRHLHMSEASERLIHAFKAYTDEHGKSGSGIKRSPCERWGTICEQTCGKHARRWTIKWCSTLKASFAC